MKKSKICGFLALPRSYFSLTTSPAIALLVSLMVGISEPATLTILYFFYLLSTAFLNSYNNLMDARSDALTKDRFPIPLGLVTLREAYLFSAFTFTAAMFLSILISQINYLAGIRGFHRPSSCLSLFFPKHKTQEVTARKGWSARSAHAHHTFHCCKSDTGKKPAAWN
jgi:hypothetical protein